MQLSWREAVTFNIFILKLAGKCYTTKTPPEVSTATKGCKIKNKKKVTKVEKWTERIFKPDVATEHHEKINKLRIWSLATKVFNRTYIHMKKVNSKIKTEVSFI